MKRVFALTVLAVLAIAGSGLSSSEAEARGWRGHHVRVGFVRLAPVYPVYTGYCRLIATPYGYVRRCVY